MRSLECNRKSLQEIPGVQRIPLGLEGAHPGEEPVRNTTGTSGRSSSQERDRHIREKPRGACQVLPEEEPARNTTGTSGQQYPSEVPGEESSENLLRTLKQEREEQRSPGEGRKSEKMLPAGPGAGLFSKIQYVGALSEDMSRDLNTAFNGRCQRPNTYQGFKKEMRNTGYQVITFVLLVVGKLSGLRMCFLPYP